jgi:hypothetical protein
VETFPDAMRVCQNRHILLFFSRNGGLRFILSLCHHFYDIGVMLW